MVGKGSPVSENNFWRTPPEIFKYFDDKYHFVFDLAASEENKKCKEFFDEKADSLKQDWHKINGFCWLNPPYGHKLKHWIIKAYEEMLKGAKLCMLVPASVGSIYWHDYVLNKVPVIYFFRSRINFVLPDGTLKKGAMYDSALIVFDKMIGDHTIIEKAPASIKN